MLTAQISTVELTGPRSVLLPPELSCMLFQAMKSFKGVSSQAFFPV